MKVQMNISERLQAVFGVLKGVNTMPKKTLEWLDSKIRKKAIDQVQKNLKKSGSGKDISDFSEQEIEELIAAEEEDIRHGIAKGGLAAIASILGFGLFF